MKPFTRYHRDIATPAGTIIGINQFASRCLFRNPEGS